MNVPELGKVPLLARCSHAIGLLPIAALLAIGCGADTEERCRQVDSDRLMSSLSQSAEDRRVRDGGTHNAEFRPDPLPPRPSDIAWYNEHCYEGKPR